MGTQLKWTESGWAQERNFSWAKGGSPLQQTTAQAMWAPQVWGRVEEKGGQRQYLAQKWNYQETRKLQQLAAMVNSSEDKLKIQTGRTGRASMHNRRYVDKEARRVPDRRGRRRFAYQAGGRVEEK
ncbi:hypothetical protein SLA2020_316550 [Shorea laevis]